MVRAARWMLDVVSCALVLYRLARVYSNQPVQRSSRFHGSTHRGGKAFSSTARAPRPPMTSTAGIHPLVCCKLHRLRCQMAHRERLLVAHGTRHMGRCMFAGCARWTASAAAHQLSDKSAALDPNPPCAPHIPSPKCGAVPAQMCCRRSRANRSMQA
jgi:hypothetical protein